MWICMWVWAWLSAAALPYVTSTPPNIDSSPSTPAALPHCTPPVANSLLFVSTLDGQVTAIDTNTGLEKWNIYTGNPLLSSSIHRLELSNNGQWMRLVPSLSGSLYRFSGDNLEPLPISADQLLSSSFKYSDDIVIVGAKESTSIGVFPATGQVAFECSVNGCVNNSEIIKKEELYNNNNDGLYDRGERIVIRTVTQTIRAFEPLSNSEKWNFSVGQHEVSLQPNQGCIMKDLPLQNPDADFIYKIVVPEGLICALQKNAPHNIVWKHKLNSPIVNAWRTEGTRLKAIDLFGIPHIPFANKQFNTFISPSVYIGMHDRQLYIQESVKMQQMVQASSHHYLGFNEKQAIVLPWQPLPAQALAEWNSDTTALSSTADHTTTAISILYASEYVNGNGFYLYTKEDRKRIDRCKRGSSFYNAFNALIEKYKQIKMIHSSDDIEEGINWVDYEQTAYYKIMHWWREFVLIAIGTVCFYNFICNRIRDVRPPQEIIHRVIVEHPPVPMLQIPTENLSGPPTVTETPPTPFISRYHADFTPIKCLGRGGFGVVFEATNKIDQANYAVKRITLPNKKEKRERVMREVRALAKLEHKHIVRYFNSWLEEPPPDWEDPFEKKFTEDEDYTETNSVMPSVSNLKTNHILNSTVNHINGHPTESTNNDLNSFLNIPMRPRSYSVNDSFSIVFSNNSREKTSSYSKIDDEDNDNAENSTDHKISFYIDPNSNIDEVDGNETSTVNEDSTLESGYPLACEIINESGKKQKKTHRRNQSLDFRKLKNNKPDSPPCGKVYLYIQMQLCQEKSLREWLKENNNYDTRKNQVHKMFEQIVYAVEYVHLQGLIHRDLKPSNIFFSTEGHIKIGDFGLVTTIADPLSGEQNRNSLGFHDVGKQLHTQHVGTYLYMSPEQLRGEPHDFKVDIWSLGLVLLELLMPFSTEMERIDILKAVRDSRFPVEFDKTHPDEHALLLMMLSQDPNKRPSTFGIRGFPPLSQDTDHKFHFGLPPRLPRVHTASFTI